MQLLKNNNNQYNKNFIDYGFCFKYIPFIAAILAQITILVSYKIALLQQHVKPFPGTDITHCMIQYPEYIVGRIGLITTATLMIPIWITYSWFLNHWVMSLNNIKIIKIPYGTIILIGTLSGLFLMLSTATMSDGGDMNMHLHIIGASGFFVTCFINLIIVMYYVLQIWKIKPGFIPYYSYCAKLLLFVVVDVILILEILSSIKSLQPYFPKEFGNIMEWVATFVILLIVSTFSFDLRNVDIFFSKKPASFQI